jgi:hypothetical protein
MSPVGDKFRRVMRTFPGLVNCTTIDWFLQWPDEALKFFNINKINCRILNYWNDA